MTMQLLSAVRDDNGSSDPVGSRVTVAAPDPDWMLPADCRG